MRKGNSRLGITLLEVMVALVVISVTIAVARSIAEQIASAGQAATRSLDRRLHEIAQSDALRGTLAFASAPTDSMSLFDGALNDATLTTRCTDARGIEGVCRCGIRIPDTDAGVAVLERWCDASAMPDTLVADSVGLSILYLVNLANGARWITEWRQTNGLPSAIGIVRHGVGDTVIVRIGERG